MATITTDQYLDTAAGTRTAGESWTVNGCTLTIRTDTRWHANAPASMTGSLGAVTLSSSFGGGLSVDATSIRWLAFDTGTGLVPAIGTTITQGGVSGYLLGVWADYTSAPTSVGATMPAAGYLKFREVSGGPFVAGLLTGIVANALSQDTVGWLEVAVEGSWANSIFGTGIVTRGDWFHLGTTTGAANQTIQLPTNGGGAATHVAALQIETAPGSDIYEWYPAMIANGSTGGFVVAALATDARAKFVFYNGGGSAIIGSNGSTNIGFTPAVGCKIRVPNIFIRYTTSASRSTNATTTPSNRPNLTNGSYAKADFRNIDTNLRVTQNSTPTTMLVVDSCFEAYAQINAAPLSGIGTIKNIAQGFSTLVISGTQLGIDMTVGPSSYIDGVTACGMSTNTPLKLDGSGVFSNFGPTLKNISSSNVFAKTGVVTTFQINATNITIDGLNLIGGVVNPGAFRQITLKNIDYIDRSNGDTTSAGGTSYIVNFSTASGKCIVDGVTFGKGGTIAMTHPYGGFINFGSVTEHVTLRNCGSRVAPLDCGTTPTLYPAAFVGGSNYGFLKMNRVYLSNTRNGGQFANGTLFGSSFIVENVYTSTAASISITAPFQVTRGTFAIGDNYNGVRFDTAFADIFTSDTVGNLLLGYGTPTADSSYADFNFLGSSGFNSSGGVTFNNGLGSTITYEMDYFAKGHTSFQNAAYTGGSGSCTFEYQIDIGAGWNGSWLVLGGANLSSHSIDPAVGFKLKIKTTCNVSSFLTLSVLKMLTTSTLSAQADNLYPLDQVTLSFENLQPGSEVRAYAGTDPATAVEIGGIESVVGSTWSFSHSSAGVAGYIAVFALGFNPLIIPRTYASEDSSLLISQVVDRNYVNP